MITSIIELPNFHDPNPDASMATCSDFMSFDTGDNEWYVNLDVVLTESRNLTIPPGLHKYKLELLPNATGGKWTFIILANDVLNLHNDQGLIFPVYARTPAGRVLMSTDCINEFFKFYNMSGPKEGARVISTIQFVSMMAKECGKTELFAPDDMPIFTYLDRDEKLIEIINQVMYDGDIDTPVDYYRKNYIAKSTSTPYEILCIFSMRRMRDLQLFVNQYAMMANSELINSAAASKATWAGVYQQLHSSGKLVTRSTDNVMPHTPECKSYMGTFLSEIYNTPGEDFWIDVRIDPRDVSDLYYSTINTHAGFTRTTNMRKHWADLTFSATYAMDLSGRFRDTNLVMHRTCMDEVVIYNKTDLSNPLLYLDMVWWTLCSAPGLINESNTMFF